MIIQDPLFCTKGVLRTHLEQKKSSLKIELESMKTNYVLNVSEEDLCRYLVSEYSLEAPVLRENEICVHSQSEVDIDISQDWRRAISDRNRPSYVKGISIVIAVPFDGDSKLFQYRPSSFTGNPPLGEIVEQEVHLRYERIEHNAQELKKTYTRDVSEIKKYLGWVKQDVEVFNESLESLVRQLAMQRKKKLLEDQELVNALEIPIKLRDNLPQTYAVPVIRKKPKIERPKVSTEPFKQEPRLFKEEYENILEMIHNMALVMERSPQTFSKLKEEEIRNHFLMMLNAQYEGQATGETFNYGGKTDILIRAEDKNVFIAECKFWRGGKKLIKAIDQLLAYTSWRDTKTAILLFNKNQDFSSVLKKIEPTVVAHACYKREYSLKSDKLKSETIFSYVFHQSNDKNREIILTVMAFDIPK